MYDLIQKIVAGTIAGKIIAPYILILFILAMVAVFVVSRLVSGSLDEQFTNKLLDRGKATNEAVVKVEGEQLQALRLMANTNGVAEAMIAKDVEQVRTFVYPLQVNARLDLCDLITTDGKMLLALRGDELGLDPESVIDVNLGKSAIVQKVLSGSTDDLGDILSQTFGGGGAQKLPEVVRQFEEKGMREQVDSWVRTGPNKPVDRRQIEDVFGQRELETIARGRGIDRDQLAEVLAKYIPRIIDELTPQGQLPRR